MPGPGEITRLLEELAEDQAVHVEVPVREIPCGLHHDHHPRLELVVGCGGTDHLQRRPPSGLWNVVLQSRVV